MIESRQSGWCVFEDGEFLATAKDEETAARISSALIQVRDAELPGGLIYQDRDELEKRLQNALGDDIAKGLLKGLRDE